MLQKVIFHFGNLKTLQKRVFHFANMNFLCFPHWNCDLFGCRSRACLVDGAFKSLCLALSKREIKSGSWSSGLWRKRYLSRVTRNFRFWNFFLVWCHLYHNQYQIWIAQHLSHLSFQTYCRPYPYHTPIGVDLDPNRAIWTRLKDFVLQDLSSVFL